MSIAYLPVTSQLPTVAPAQPASPTIDELLELAQHIFSFVKADDFRWRIANLPCFSCCAAREGTALVGFKLGYATKSTHYYSWLGGVHPEFLRQGIAGQLMQQQHDWLREQGFASVETGAQETNQAMQQLNLASGFVPVGHFDKPRGREITYLKFL